MLVLSGTGDQVACKYLQHQEKIQVLPQDYNMKKIIQEAFQAELQTKVFLINFWATYQDPEQSAPNVKLFLVAI